MTLSDVVLVKVFFIVIPAHRVKTVLYLEDHRRETTHCGQVILPRDLLVVCIENETRLGAHLTIETSEDQN